ncbi:MAG: DUF4040 domain-containing protein [Lachnospiraceae bacterium]|nr:DUF4040 domain-containing protein [Lachnospiraceae bacterium]
MNDILMIMLCLFLIFCAVVVSFTKSTLSAIVIFYAYSLVMDIIWILMESPDLGITEAAVGAGVTGILFYATLKKINQIDLDFEPDMKKAEQTATGDKKENE